MPKITIPGIPFAALKLARNADGSVSFDISVVEQIEQASGLEPGHFMERPEDAVAELIVGWYAAHRAAGGAVDAVAEDLIAETRLEDQRGGGISHQPGRA